MAEVRRLWLGMVGEGKLFILSAVYAAVILSLIEVEC